MTELTESEVALQAHKLEIEKLWYFFFRSPGMRVYDCEANQSILDNFLDTEMLDANMDNIKIAFQECLPQLARIDEAQQAARRAKRAAEVVPAEPVAPEDPSKLPSSITRKTLVSMDREQYRQLLRKFGDDAITERLNQVEA